EIEPVDGLKEVELRVIDSGVGISPEDLDRIFGDFVTIDATYGRSHTGTGLGLGIAQRLAMALDGELGAESEPGDGSVFWLRLPMNAPKGYVGPSPTLPQIQEEELPEIPPLDILMVEDNEVNRIVARELLERDGHHVSEAHDGRKGVEAAEAGQFDVILMDVSMPEMDGVTATRLIRNGHSASATTPIIATTAHALPDDLHAFREAGMNDVLIKPVSARSLRMILAQALLHDDVDDGDERVSLTALDAGELLVDWDRLTDLQEDLSPDQLRFALTQFREDFSTFISQLPHWIGHEEHRNHLSQEAHRMAGSAGVFGAMRLTSQMRRLQNEALTADRAQIESLVKEAETCWTETHHELSGLGSH
ncbi:MAG: response regulator, partial [Paracoccaceae bacterium]